MFDPKLLKQLEEKDKMKQESPKQQTKLKKSVTLMVSSSESNVHTDSDIENEIVSPIITK